MTRFPTCGLAALDGMAVDVLGPEPEVGAKGPPGTPEPGGTEVGDAFRAPLARAIRPLGASPRAWRGMVPTSHGTRRAV